MRVCDMLATCFRHAFDFFCRKPGREPAASISTCGRHYVLSKFAAGFRLAFNMLSTCFRHAHASRKPNLQPGLQLVRIMECGLKGAALSPFPRGLEPAASIHVHSGLRSAELGHVGSRAHISPRSF